MILAGFGSRETPTAICNLMTEIARKNYKNGGWLRSGGAKGADEAFEAGAGADRLRSYEPWESQRHPHWAVIAAAHHPAWDRCTSYAKLLHSRNVPIILGDDLLSPSIYGVCWTKNGGITGATGQTIRIAQAYNIPVYNLHDPATLKWFKQWVRI